MKLKHIGALIAISVLTTSAFAGDWYIAGSAGNSKYDISKSTIDNSLNSVVTGLTSSLKDSDTGYKLQLGYQISQNLAIEGGYVDLGKATYTGKFTGPVAGNVSADVKASGWNVAAVGILPLSQDFSVFGKAGLIIAKVDATATASGSGASAKVSGSATNTKGTWGVGASYSFTKNLALRGEWERFNNLGDANTTGEGNVDLVSLGLVYKF